MRFAACVIALLLVSAIFAAADQPTTIAPRDIRTFRPSANGFAFVNHFEGSSLPGGLGALTGDLQQRLGGPSSYGLCGGMSFAAADLFLAGRPPPDRTNPPTRGEKLFDYIQKRQITSIGDGLTLAGTFGRWMALPDDGVFGTRRLSLDQIDDLRASLDRGEPAIIGLVFRHHIGNKHARGAAGSPWENHQVLGYALAADPKDPRAFDFRIYDPNYPKADDAVIHCREVVTGTMLAAPWGGWRVPVYGAECERRVGTRSKTLVRGIIAMPYAATDVPSSLE
jgi:hypothetical protein